MDTEDIACDLKGAPISGAMAREIEADRLAGRALDAVALAREALRGLIECDRPLDAEESRSAVEGAVTALGLAWRDLDRSMSLS